MTAQIIEPSDIMPMQEYARVRDARRRAIADMKKNRRVHVGPDITFYFENRETMLHQVHEMLAVEKGGEPQIEDELRAYNPLIPRGRELVATMMIEIDDALRRDRVLRQLGGIENTATITIGDETINARPESDVERTTADGKTSSLHFLRFAFTDKQVAAFRDKGTRAVLALSHPGYDHMAAIAEPVRMALAADFS
ncbi:MAG: DUF3501 family protein [Rhodospirillales bacterium]|nr:DUF3501 family protein [Rhodospirillales bacterium]